MPILSLLAKLGLDKTGFDAGMTAAGKSVNRFAGDIKNQLAGAFSVAAMLAWTRNVMQATNRIKDLSEQFGITTDEVQRADHALEQSGLAFENLTQALSKIGQTRRDAVEGNEDLRRTFERYGITLRQLNDPQLRNFDLLMKISEATARMNITAREQVELQDLLGARAVKLVNVLRDLSTVQPPTLVTKDDIEQIDRAEKALKALYKTAQAESAPFVGGAATAWAAALRAGVDFVTGRRQEGSNLPKAIGGGMNPAELLGRLMSDRVSELLIKPNVTDAAKAGMTGLLQKVFGAPVAAPGGLFEVDKDIKTSTAKKEKAERGFVPKENGSGLGAIGVFTGARGGSESAQIQAMDKLTRIHNALVREGIIVKDVK